MSERSNNKLKNVAKAAALLLPVCLCPARVEATDFTAGIVVTEMEEGDRYPFVAGVIEGLSYARYVKDGNDSKGMMCIYDWFFREGTIGKIYDAFHKFPDYAPAAVVLAMTEKECGL